LHEKPAVEESPVMQCPVFKLPSNRLLSLALRVTIEMNLKVATGLFLDLAAG